MRPFPVAAVAAVALLGPPATAADASPTASPPCNVTFHRLAGGHSLRVSLICSADDVEIVRMDFAHAVKIQSQTPFRTGNCRTSTPSVWFCYFYYHVPANTAIPGTVRFATSIPRTPQRVRLAFYTVEPDVVGVQLVESPELATVTY